MNQTQEKNVFIDLFCFPQKQGLRKGLAWRWFIWEMIPQGRSDRKLKKWENIPEIKNQI